METDIDILKTKIYSGVMASPFHTFECCIFSELKMNSESCVVWNDSKFYRIDMLIAIYYFPEKNVLVCDPNCFLKVHQLLLSILRFQKGKLELEGVYKR